LEFTTTGIYINRINIQHAISISAFRPKVTDRTLDAPSQSAENRIQPAGIPENNPAAEL